MLTNVSLQTNSVDQNQLLLGVEASITFQQTTKQTTFVVISTLRVNLFFFPQVCNLTTFLNSMHAGYFSIFSKYFVI